MSCAVLGCTREMPVVMWVTPGSFPSVFEISLFFKLQSEGMWSSVHFSITVWWLGAGDNSAEGAGGLSQDMGAPLHDRCSPQPMAGADMLVDSLSSKTRPSRAPTPTPPTSGATAPLTPYPVGLVHRFETQRPMRPMHRSQGGWREVGAHPRPIGPA